MGRDINFDYMETKQLKEEAWRTATLEINKCDIEGALAIAGVKLSYNIWKQIMIKHGDMLQDKVLNMDQAVEIAGEAVQAIGK